jgi:hypothetical protein
VKPELDLTNPPYQLVQLAKAARGDVDTFLADLELHDDLHDAVSTRQQARELISFATQEAEKDALAAAPSGISVLESKANKLLGKELDRLTKAAELYAKVLEQSGAFDYELPNGNTVSQEMAAEALEQITERTMAIKKSLSDDKKASQAAPEGATFNLAVIVGNAIDNIKKQSEPIVIEQQ